MSLLAKYPACCVISMTMTVPESSSQGQFPLYLNFKIMKPLASFHYAFLVFIGMHVGPRALLTKMDLDVPVM
jgi:hypothetical protein